MELLAVIASARANGISHIEDLEAPHQKRRILSSVPGRSRRLLIAFTVEEIMLRSGREQRICGQDACKTPHIKSDRSSAFARPIAVHSLIETLSDGINYLGR